MEGQRPRLTHTQRPEQLPEFFEFKLGGTAEEALQQIRDQQYGAAYRDDGREILSVGVAFGTEERNLTDWLIETTA